MAVVKKIQLRNGASTLGCIGDLIANNSKNCGRASSGGGLRSQAVSRFREGTVGSPTGNDD